MKKSLNNKVQTFIISYGASCGTRTHMDFSVRF